MPTPSVFAFSYLSSYASHDENDVTGTVHEPNLDYVRLNLGLLSTLNLYALMLCNYPEY